MIAKNLSIIAHPRRRSPRAFGVACRALSPLPMHREGVNIGYWMPKQQRNRGALAEICDGLYERQPEAIKLICISQNFSDRRARPAHLDSQSLAR